MNGDVDSKSAAIVFAPGAPVDDLRNALRAAGAVIAEEPEPRRDTFNP